MSAPDLTTLADLSARYDAFLIDQFGVLLDGDGAYPFAVAALSRLAQTGKPVVILSNSGKRAAPNEARLTRLGFDRAAYRRLLSSGEAAFGAIAARIGVDMQAGAAVWLHARDGDQSAIAGLDLRLVDDPSAADLVIIAGSQADRLDRDWYRNTLAPAAARGVECYCTNPDLEMLTKHGPRFGAGAIAALYAELGGCVTYIGKPHRLIYDIARAELGGIDPRRILCIGDSPAHDALGGTRAGFATALTYKTGLHAGADIGTIAQACRAFGARLDHIIPAFEWKD